MTHFSVAGGRSTSICQATECRRLEHTNFISTPVISPYRLSFYGLLTYLLTYSMVQSPS